MKCLINSVLGLGICSSALADIDLNQNPSSGLRFIIDNSFRGEPFYAQDSLGKGVTVFSNEDLYNHIIVNDLPYSSFPEPSGLIGSLGALGYISARRRK